MCVSLNTLPIPAEHPAKSTPSLYRRGGCSQAQLGPCSLAKPGESGTGQVRSVPTVPALTLSPMQKTPWLKHRDFNPLTGMWI